MQLAFKSLATLMLLATLVAADGAENVSENDGKSTADVGEEPTFGLVDLIVLAGLGAGAIYYFFFRKKPEESRVSQYVIQPTTVPSPSSGSVEKGFVGKMKHSKRRLVVFYGSQTG